MIRSLDSAAYDHVSNSQQRFLYPSSRLSRSLEEIYHPGSNSNCFSSRTICFSSNRSIDSAGSSSSGNSSGNNNTKTIMGTNSDNSSGSIPEAAGPFRKLRRIKRRLLLEAAGQEDSASEVLQQEQPTSRTGSSLTSFTNSSTLDYYDNDDSVEIPTRRRSK